MSFRRLLIRPTVRSRRFGLLGKGCRKLAVEATTSTRFCSPAPEVTGLSGIRTNRSAFELVDNSALRGKTGHRSILWLDIQIYLCDHVPRIKQGGPLHAANTEAN